MLFQEVTPDTANYLILGYVVLIGGPLLYLLSYVLRRRNLERDIQLMESLKDETEK
jgi:predicted metallo-beta-lactamase superfamily hydrolase